LSSGGSSSSGGGTPGQGGNQGSGGGVGSGVPRDSRLERPQRHGPAERPRNDLVAHARRRRSSASVNAFPSSAPRPDKPCRQRFARQRRPFGDINSHGMGGGVLPGAGINAFYIQ